MKQRELLIKNDRLDALLRKRLKTVARRNELNNIIENLEIEIKEILEELGVKELSFDTEVRIKMIVELEEFIKPPNRQDFWPGPYQKPFSIKIPGNTYIG